MNQSQQEKPSVRIFAKKGRVTTWHAKHLRDKRFKPIGPFPTKGKALEEALNKWPDVDTVSVQHG